MKANVRTSRGDQILSSGNKHHVRTKSLLYIYMLEQVDGGGDQILSSGNEHHVLTKKIPLFNYLPLCIGATVHCVLGAFLTKFTAHL